MHLKTCVCNETIGKPILIKEKRDLFLLSLIVIISAVVTTIFALLYEEALFAGLNSITLLFSATLFFTIVFIGKLIHSAYHCRSQSDRTIQDLPETPLTNPTQSQSVVPSQPTLTQSHSVVLSRPTLSLPSSNISEERREYVTENGSLTIIHKIPFREPRPPGFCGGGGCSIWVEGNKLMKGNIGLFCDYSFSDAVQRGIKTIIFNDSLPLEFTEIDNNGKTTSFYALGFRGQKVPYPISQSTEETAVDFLERYSLANSHDKFKWVGYAPKTGMLVAYQPESSHLLCGLNLDKDSSFQPLSLENHNPRERSFDDSYIQKKRLFVEDQTLNLGYTEDWSKSNSTELKINGYQAILFDYVQIKKIALLKRESVIQTLREKSIPDALVSIINGY